MKRLTWSLPVWLPLLAIVGVLLMQLHAPTLFLTMRNFVFDTYQRWQPRGVTTSRVLIVDIDEASLKRFGQWPWPRTLVATMIRRLNETGAATVALDLLLAERDRSSPGTFLSPWFDNPEVRRLAAELPDHDVVLAETMAQASVSTGFFLTPDGNGDRAPKEKAGFAFVGPKPTTLLPEFRGAITTLPKLEMSAHGNGALNFIPSIDGRVRRVPLLVRYRDRLYPSLSAETLRVAAGRRGYAVKRLPGQGEILLRIGKTRVPLNARGELWLHYAKPRPEQYIPAWKVIEGQIEPEAIHDAIVLVGTSAAGLRDRHLSPLGDSVPGVEIHAQVIEQILERSFLTRPDWAKGAELTLQVIAAFAVMLIATYAGAVWGAVVAGLAVTAALAGSAAAFVGQGWLLDPLSGSATLLAVYLIASLTRYIRTERERRWIQNAFSSYISPNLVRHLIRHPEELRLGGERRDCSFVLTDLADFTSLIEGSDPADLTALINEYLDRMTAIAFAHDGTIDRIVGDAVAVLFSAPVLQPDHACRAMACAVDMDEFARAFAQRKRAEGFPLGETRIGVHSGPVIVGNFGSGTQLDYRALGDAINTASRLEGANKYLGTRICASGDTVRQCPDFVGRPVGMLHLKGKKGAIEAYEPLTPTDAAAPSIRAYLECYRKLERGDEAIERAFAELAEEYPTDPLAWLHLHRLQAGGQGVSIVLHNK